MKKNFQKTVSSCLAILCAIPASAGFEPMEVWAETGAYVIDVTDYGADADGKKDSTEAILEALNHAEEYRSENASQEIILDFPEGTYQLYPDKAEERELYVSNTVGANQDYKNKKIGILVEDMDNLTIDGNHSDFIFHGKMTTFAAVRSENVEFRNFSVDFAVPTVVDITVESVEGDTAIVYIPECYNYEVKNGELHWYSDESPYTGEYYWTGINRFENYYNQSIDLKTGITTRQNQLFDNCRGIEDLGNHRVKFSYSGKPGSVQPGMCYQMRPTLRDTPGTFFWLSKDVSMENLDIQYLHGFGMVGQTTENVSLKDVDFKAPEKTGRTTAGYADFLQMSGCKGKILVEDCYFANPHDDPINIHGTFQQVLDISQDRREVTVRYNHNETAGFPSFAPGDEVEFTRQSDLIAAENSVRTVEKIISGPTGDSSDNINLTDTVIRFTEPVPEEIKVWEYAAENITFTPEVEIKNCIFKEIPTRGILVTTRKPVVIENNIFEGTSMAAIYISCDAQSWHESGRVEDVSIRNNDFYRCKGDGTIFIEPTNPYVSTEKTVHKNIRIEGNRFYQEGNCAINAKSVDGIQIRDNEIYRFEPDVEVKLSADGEESCTLAEGESLQAGVEFHKEEWDRDLYSFNGCKNVQMENNTYDAGLKMNVSIWNMQESDVQIGENEGISIGSGRVTDTVGTVYYESSNPETAVVSQEGVITGVSRGTAEIRAYMVNNGKRYVSGVLTVTVEAGQKPEGVETENPIPKELSDAFEIIRPVRETWKLSGKDLCIMPEGNGNWAGGNHASNIFLTETKNKENVEVVVQIEGKTQEGYEEAGLVFYRDDDNYSALQRKHANGNPKLNLTTETNQSPSEAGRDDLEEENIWLKMIKAGDLVSGYYSTDGKNWELVHEQENSELGNSFKVGILCTCGNGTTPITFRDFAVNKAAVPFGQDLEIPVVLSNCSLKSVTCENIDFKQFERTRKYYAAEAGGAKTAEFQIVPEEGASIEVLLNGQVIVEQTETVSVPLKSGINAVEMFVTAEDGTSRSVYRYVIMNYVEMVKETRLDILIQKAEELLESEELYTSDSVEKLKTAIAKAKDTEEEIQQAYNNLGEAMTSLVRKANKEELANALKKAENILKEQDKYLELSIAGLEEVLKEAKNIYEREDASMEQVSETVKSLVNEIMKARILGDVNGNGVVDTEDAAKILVYSAELEVFSAEQQQLGDINQDTETDSRDAEQILRYAAEKINSFESQE